MAADKWQLPAQIYRAGSIEQKLDMCESGPLRGDEIEHSHGVTTDEEAGGRNYHFDLATAHREGDEETGDDHSSGLQGGEFEIEDQPHILTGMPGDITRKMEGRVGREKTSIPYAREPRARDMKLSKRRKKA